MRSKSKNPRPIRRRPPRALSFQRAIQISESHCGPAVLQMLLGNLGVLVTQEEVAEAGGATELIELNGMRVDQLAHAVRKLAPQTTFWYKDHSSLEELIRLVKEYEYPVGVEWQGLFEDDDEDDDDEEDESETGEDDFGHYSIVTQADVKNRLLVIVDPYKDYADQDRIFTFKEFTNRWWDFNEVPDSLSRRPRYVEDYHMMFIITPKEAIFPQELGMKTYD